MLSSISGAMTRLSSCRVSRKWLALPLVFVVGGVYLGTPATSGHQPSSYQPYKGSLTPFVLTPTPTVTSMPASPTPEPTFTPSPAPSASRTTAVKAVPTISEARAWAKRKIGSRQFACLDVLWERESGWRTKARNKSSGAYGIPQALPGDKMAKAGADWRTNPVTQVKWGLGYIKGRYGSACNAWEHFTQRGWY